MARLDSTQLFSVDDLIEAASVDQQAIEASRIAREIRDLTGMDMAEISERACCRTSEDVTYVEALRGMLNEAQLAADAAEDESYNSRSMSDERANRADAARDM